MVSAGWRGRTDRRPAPSPAPAAAQGRYRFIDDLRGIAAAGVAASHLFDHLPLVSSVSEHGRFGVEIFFVISGFVMAHSIGDRAVGRRFAGRFLLRRAIRLDPVYWVAMVVTLVVWALIGWQPLRGPSDVAINAVYLQDLLEAPRVVSVAWTLALELQFYLCFIALLALCQTLVRRGLPIGPVRVAVFGSSALVSAMVYSLWAAHPAIEAVANVPGLFTAYWFMFVLGVLIEWVHRRGVPSSVFWVALGSIAALDLVAQPGPLIPEGDLSALVAVGAAAVVFAASRTTLLGRGLGSAPIAYLGRVSYSLYLIHPIVGITLIDRTHWRFGGGPAIATGATALGVVASLVAAHLLYVAVESPAVRLSRRIDVGGPPGSPIVVGRARAPAPPEPSSAEPSSPEPSSAEPSSPEPELIDLTTPQSEPSGEGRRPPRPTR